MYVLYFFPIPEVEFDRARYGEEDYFEYFFREHYDLTKLTWTHDGDGMTSELVWNKDYLLPGR